MIYKTLKSHIVQLQNLHMSEKSSTFAPDFKIYFGAQN